MVWQLLEAWRSLNERKLSSQTSFSFSRNSHRWTAIQFHISFSVKEANVTLTTIWQKHKPPCNISANICIFIKARSTAFTQFLFNSDLETWCLHWKSRIHPIYTLIIAPIFQPLWQQWLATIISIGKINSKPLNTLWLCKERHSGFSKETAIALEITTVFKTQTSKQEKKRPSPILRFKIFVSLLNNLQK